MRKKGFQWKKPTDPLLFQRTESPLKRSLKTETKWNISKNFSTRSMPKVRGNEKKKNLYWLLRLATTSEFSGMPFNGLCYGSPVFESST